MPEFNMRLAFGQIELIRAVVFIVQIWLSNQITVNSLDTRFKHP